MMFFQEAQRNGVESGTFATNPYTGFIDNPETIF